MLSFKPTFSLSYFTVIKRLFSFSSLCAIRVVSSAYLRLLIFLREILIPVCASSSPAFLMMCSAYKLNKQEDNIQPLTYSFSYLEPVCCSMSSSNCCLLTCIQVSQEAGQCYALCLNPRAGREKASKAMQLAKRVSLLLTRARALCYIQRSGAGQRAPSPSCYTNLWVKHTPFVVGLSRLVTSLQSSFIGQNFHTGGTFLGFSAPFLIS